MPELPEVETIKTAVQKAIGYSYITKVSVNNNRFREIIPEDFAAKVTGCKIVSYQRIAKYMVLGLDNGFSIIWHLGMSGRVKISETLPEQIEKHDHVIIETSNGCVIYNDARRFGLMTYCRSNELSKHPLFGKMGIDPFDENLSGGYLYDKFREKKTAVKEALLDQHIINGIGNIYASESLFAAGISPLRKAGSLTKEECSRLVEEIRAVLDKAIKAGGSTLRDYRKPDGTLGYFQNEHCVYNKTGQKCPGCICEPSQTGGILKIVQGGRSTFYCATKQK